MANNGKGKTDAEKIAEFRDAKKVWYEGYDSSTRVNDSVGEIQYRAEPKKAEPKVKKAETKVESKRKIAICGTADSLPSAPYADNSWTIWGCAPCLTYPHFKRWDLLFEIHDEDYVADKVITDRLKRADCRILMQRHFDEIPKSEPLPLKEMSDGYHKNYTNTIAMMIAYAVYEQKVFNDIELMGVWGVNMGAEEEYSFQRPSCEYWLGIAEAKGIKVEIHGENSAVLKCNTIYGYDKEWTWMREARQRKKQLEIGEKDLAQKVEEMKQHYWQQQGAIKDVQYFLRKYE